MAQAFTTHLCGCAVGARHDAERTVMVGDSEAADIAGAHAAGMRAVLLCRSGDGTSGDADEVIAALHELPGALRNMGLYLD